MNRAIGTIIISWTLLLAGIPSPGVAQTGDFALGTLLQRALEHNPELKAAEYRWQLYENKVPQAGVLADPSLSFGLSNYPVDSWAGNESPMSGKLVKLSQSLPFPGKLSTVKEKSKQQALWFKGVYEDEKLQLAWKVKDAYYSLFFFDRALKITQKNLALLDDFVRLTETNYEIGKGLLQDVLKAQVAHSRLIDRTYSYNKQYARALADLNSLTDQQLDFPDSDLPELEPVVLAATAEELHQTFEKNRPLYSSYLALIEQNRLQKKLARLDFRPDFKLGASYTFREPNPADGGTDFSGIEVGIDIPLHLGKRKAAVAEAESGINMAERQLDNFRNLARLNIQDSVLKIRQSEKQVELYRSGLIPQSRQTFEAALSGYQVGKIDFLALLDSIMTVYDYELEYYRVMLDGRRGLARLEAEIGAVL
ncbi:MAG: TolC family protein [Proteobacteria bacterium]|nr:TolC family protein [Pseudomonadota bacterium]MBU1737836.1 TolC family protein [Pseudomonadota bacterium]